MVTAIRQYGRREKTGQMFEIVICDDEQADRERLQGMLVGTWYNGIYCGTKTINFENRGIRIYGEIL